MARARAPIDVADALKLLGPERSYQHELVRAFAVEHLREQDGELLMYLLQLVQALRYEPQPSALARARSSPTCCPAPSAAAAPPPRPRPRPTADLKLADTGRCRSRRAQFLKQRASTG